MWRLFTREIVKLKTQDSAGPFKLKAEYSNVKKLIRYLTHKRILQPIILAHVIKKSLG